MFVCHGNICRSPMAEFVMKELVRKKGIDNIYIESSATSREEIGSAIYPPAAQVLASHGIGSRGHRARQITVEDYNRCDLVVVMDFVQETPTRWMGDDISDPWYHGGFDKTYSEILKGCEALLLFLGY